MELTKFIGEVLSIAQFCNPDIRDIFGIWDLREMENYNSNGMWGPQEKEIRPNGTIHTS